MKKFKSLKRSRRDEDEAPSEDDDIPKSTTKTSKKTKTAGEGESGKDAEGNPFWTLSNTRRVGLSEFKGRTFVNIREYYTDAAGDLKPGKKGISLPLEQYSALLAAVPAINTHLREQGHDLSDVPSGPPIAPRSESPTKEKKQKPKKANIEATSDEDESN
jgi:hypothetical protein